MSRRGPRNRRPKLSEPDFASEDRTFLRAMEEARAVYDKDREEQERAPAERPARQGRTARRRRGSPTIDERLDLHGLNVEQALHRLESFVVRASALRRRRLLIITGRGHRSAGGVPKLRRATRRWLEREQAKRATGSARTRLSSFREAPPELGGEGAFVVELA